jgi:hypothetical protein
MATRGAGHDADRLPGTKRARGRVAGRDLLDDRELERAIARGRRPVEVGVADGIAVHRGIRPGRDRGLGDNALGEDAAHGGEDADPLGTERIDGAQDVVERLLDAQTRQHAGLHRRLPAAAAAAALRGRRGGQTPGDSQPPPLR